MLKLKNDGKTTLSADINSTVTSITVTDGSVFPALSINEWFPLTLIKLSNIERMRVTSVSGNVLTVIRGSEETTAQSWLTGDDCILALTAGGYKELQDSVYDLELGVSVEIGELKAIARSLNEPDENVGYDTAGLIVKKYIYLASSQVIYSAPSTAIGKTISSVVGSTLNTTEPASYQMEFNSISSIDDRVAANESDILNLFYGQSSGLIVFPTYALLTAYMPLNTEEEKGSFKVTNDLDSSLNGYYSWVSGTSYTKDADLVVNVIAKTNTSDAVSGAAVFGHVAGTTEPLFGTSFPGASEYWETLSENPNTDELQILDADGRIIYSASNNSTEVYYDGIFETLSESEQDLLIIDKDNIIMNTAPTPQDLAVLQTAIDNLDVKTSISLNDYGLSRTHTFGGWYLRETRQRTRKRILEEVQQLTILNIGDSWTHNAERYSGPLGITLQTLFGDAGAGFTGFSWGFGNLPDPGGANKNFDPTTTYYALEGAWTASYSSQPSPDICSADSSEIGAYVNLTTTKPATVATLYATSNGAEVRYNFNDGLWTNLPLSAVDGFYSLTGMPVGAGFNLKIEVVSGAVELYGIDLHNDSDGVVIHKVGATGSKMSQWATQSNSQTWRDNIANLSPNLITILHGTNDQANDSKATFKGNGKLLIDNIRTALPLADILLIAPCENGAGRTVQMSDYQDALQELAYENKRAFLNLQHVFGEDYSEYASTSPRNWFNVDTIHPEPLTGGRVIVDAVIRTLLNN